MAKYRSMATKKSTAIKAMQTLGQKLKAKRAEKKITTSEAARLTRIKIQHIEALEQDDFSSIAAPAYAKGFLRIYCELLGLDPAPLIEEYMEKHSPAERAPLLPDTEAAQAEAKESRSFSLPTLPKIKWPTINWSAFKLPKIQMPRWSLPKFRRPRFSKRLALVYSVAAVLFLLIFLLVARCGRIPPDADTPPILERPAPQVVSGPDEAPSDHRRLPIVDLLPEPYLE
jgi:transcriptional regulator with XRE-family HTH domain